MEGSGGGRRWHWALVGVAAVAAVALGWRFFHDDAYITLRYVSRWVAGKGLTWTDGPPVEGYTHPAWLLQLAGLHWLGLDPVVAARGLGVAWLGALVAAWAGARAHPLVLAAVLFLPAVAAWSVGGLETVSFATWLVAGAALLERVVFERASWRWALAAGVVLGGATLTRPEGLAAVVVGLAWVASTRSVTGSFALLGGAALPLAPFAVFRWVTYGTWVSTSSTAKLGDLTPWFQLGMALEYLQANAHYLAITAVIVVGGLLGGRAKALWIPLSLVVPLFAVLLLAGGDHMPHGRFLVPMIVLLAFGAGRAMVTSTRKLGVGLVVASFALTAVAWLVVPVERDRAASLGRPVGHLLARHLAPGSLVAAATAGSTPYFAPGLNFVDTLGLNDPTIASRPIHEIRAAWQALPGHRKGDGRYVLSKAPDVIVLGGATGMLSYQPARYFLTDRELLENPGFRSDYEPFGYRLPFTEFDVEPVNYEVEDQWPRATGLPIDRAPAAMMPDGAQPSRMLFLWLRRDDPVAEGLRRLGTPLTEIDAAAERSWPQFCAQLTGLLLGSVPCDDGSPAPRPGREP